jgi:V/A-type H+/Na+-transporting ATPase subunit I
MSRVAIVAPRSRLRATLALLADAGVAELVGPLPAAHGEPVEALRRLERAAAAPSPPTPRVAAEPPDVGLLERAGHRDLLAGEVELARHAESAVAHGRFAALLAWVPSAQLPALAARLAATGGTAVELPRPRFVEPPTLLRPGRAGGRFAPLVETYGATRYADVDPTPFAAASFVLMFGMMFGDVGHGLVLAALGLALRRSRSPRWAGVRRLWVFPFAGGLAAALAGLLYGEAFGPTGLVPTLWLAPLDEPVKLLGVAGAVGAILLAISYALGIVNRWREGGPVAALLAPSGFAGLAVFTALALLGLALYVGQPVLLVAGLAVGLAGVALHAVAFVAETDRSRAAIVQVLIELFDAVERVAANLISFTRLGAFGLMHAALGSIVLDGARGLWGAGPGGAIAAIAVFAVGNALAFTLEALVAGVQAMRLEYYELFSRLFAGEGRPFRAWRIPMVGKPA